MSIFGTLLATLIYDSVVWHVVKDGKRRNRLEARLPRQARTPIFPNYDDAQYNDNRNGAEMAGQITCRIITGEFYEFLWRRFFLLVVLLFLMKRAGRRDASATVGGVRESIARQEEYRELLKRSGVDYDERFLW